MLVDAPLDGCQVVSNPKAQARLPRCRGVIKERKRAPGPPVLAPASRAQASRETLGSNPYSIAIRGIPAP